MEEKEQSSRVEFTPPKGASLPETAGGGKEFDLVCSFVLEGDKVRMTKFGDTPMEAEGGEEKVSRPESKPDYSDYIRSMQGEGGPAQ